MRSAPGRTPFDHWLWGPVLRLLVPRTGLEPAGLAAADFHHTTPFGANPFVRGLFVRWTMPSPLLVPSGRRPPSSLYTFPAGGAWLGVASIRSGVSPNLKGFTRELSHPAAQAVSSPLCLPISPPRHWAAFYPVLGPRVSHARTRPRASEAAPARRFESVKRPTRSSAMRCRPAAPRPARARRRLKPSSSADRRCASMP